MPPRLPTPVLLSMLCLIALPACGDEPCPAGTTASGDRCITADTGPGDSSTDSTMGDAGDAGDTAVDAGRCAEVCMGPTPLCNETTGMCVVCLADADCSDLTAPQCDETGGTCGACDSGAACMDRTGTTVCAAAGANMGGCVECTATEATACGANPCRPDDTCSAEPADQVECQPCDTDLNCATGRVCVEMSYADPTPGVVGSFCLWRRDAALPGPNGTCGLSSRPYAQAQSVDTVDGEASVDICTLATTTCTAFNQHRDPGSCDTAGDDTQCGAPDFNDGRCRNNSSAEPRCSYPCGGTEDCRSGFTCPAAGDQFCSL